MAKIFSIDSNSNINNEIIIDDKYVVRDDEYIAFEFPNSFSWLHHAQNCKDCKAFLNSFFSDTYRWLLELNEEYFLLDLKDFGNYNEHLKNLSQFTLSDNFSGTRLKLKKTEIAFSLLEALRIYREAEEKYENCAELKSIIKFSNKE